jgi:hypothetical protein
MSSACSTLENGAGSTPTRSRRPPKDATGNSSIKTDGEESPFDERQQRAERVLPGEGGGLRRPGHRPDGSPIATAQAKQITFSAEHAGRDR